MGGYYIDTSHADDVVRIDDVVAPLQARDYKGGKLVLQAVPCALRNRGGGKEIEVRMDDDKSNALTSVQTDSLVFTLRIRCGCDGGGKGALIQTDKSGTLACNNDQTLIIINDQGGG